MIRYYYIYVVVWVCYGGIKISVLWKRIILVVSLWFSGMVYIGDYVFF